MDEPKKKNRLYPGLNRMPTMEEKHRMAAEMILADPDLKRRELARRAHNRFVRKNGGDEQAPEHWCLTALMNRELRTGPADSYLGSK